MKHKYREKTEGKKRGKNKDRYFNRWCQITQYLFAGKGWNEPQPYLISGKTLTQMVHR